MNETPLPVSAGELYARLGTASAPVLIDVRRHDSYINDDKLIIGAYEKDIGATDAGAAYLFSTNGTLLTTFTNPTPAVGDLFGSAVAGVGPDKVVISVLPLTDKLPKRGGTTRWSPKIWATPGSPPAHASWRRTPTACAMYRSTGC